MNGSQHRDGGTIASFKPDDVQIKEVFQHGAAALGTMKSLMKVNMMESPTAYHFEADMPGIRKEHIDIVVHGTMLTVTAERKSVHNEELWKSHHRELQFGKVERSFKIPGDADADHTKAAFEDGLLRVSVPKKWKEEDFGPLDFCSAN